MVDVTVANKEMIYGVCAKCYRLYVKDVHGDVQLFRTRRQSNKNARVEHTFCKHSRSMRAFVRTRSVHNLRKRNLTIMILIIYSVTKVALSIVELYLILLPDTC